MFFPLLWHSSQAKFETDLRFPKCLGPVPSETHYEKFKLNFHIPDVRLLLSIAATAPNLNILGFIKKILHNHIITNLLFFVMSYISFGCLNPIEVSGIYFGFE